MDHSFHDLSKKLFTEVGEKDDKMKSLALALFTSTWFDHNDFDVEVIPDQTSLSPSEFPQKVFGKFKHLAEGDDSLKHAMKFQDCELKIRHFQSDSLYCFEYFESFSDYVLTLQRTLDSTKHVLGRKHLEKAKIKARRLLYKTINLKHGLESEKGSGPGFDQSKVKIVANKSINNARELDERINKLLIEHDRLANHLFHHQSRHTLGLGYEPYDCFGICGSGEYRCHSDFTFARCKDLEAFVERRWQFRNQTNDFDSPWDSVSQGIPNERSDSAVEGHADAYSTDIEDQNHNDILSDILWSTQFTPPSSGAGPHSMHPQSAFTFQKNEHSGADWNAPPFPYPWMGAESFDGDSNSKSSFEIPGTIISAQAAGDDKMQCHRTSEDSRTDFKSMKKMDSFEGRLEALEKLLTEHPSLENLPKPVNGASTVLSKVGQDRMQKNLTSFRAAHAKSQMKAQAYPFLFKESGCDTNTSTVDHDEVKRGHRELAERLAGLWRNEY